MNLLDEITQAVELTAECPAVHLETVVVHEMIGKKTVWSGPVEIFELRGNPKAERAYAWAFEDDSETRFVTVLQIPPVDSAVTAVRLAIAQKAQK